MTDTEIKSSIEAVLFASGNSVDVSRIAQALELTEKKAKKYCDELLDEYSSRAGGITIIKLEDSYQMVSRKEFAPVVRTVMDLRRKAPLSQAALEVLAVVAYNQPVTKAFVEQVRGVDCSGVIGSLTTKELIEEKGRLELPGRPLLYGTTENFLRCFGLTSIEDLPPLPESDKKSEEETDENHDEEQLSIFDKDSEKNNADKNDDSESGAEKTITATVGEIVREAVKD